MVFNLNKVKQGSMLQEEAKIIVEEVLGKFSTLEYDPKLSSQKCWIWKRSANGYISKGYSGNSWNQAVEEMRKGEKK